MIEDYMERFSKELELEAPLKPQVPGVYKIPLEDDLSIELKIIQPQGFKLTSTLGPVPREGRDELFSEMLLANLFGQGTRGSVLGVDIDVNYVILSRSVESYVEYKQFTEIIEDFINAMDFWRDEITSK